MKILTLTILFVLAFFRVKSTPCALSKTLWKNKMIKQLKDSDKVSFTVSVIQYVTEDGNTYVYIGTEDGQIYKSLFSKNEELVFVKEGTTISGTVQDGMFYFN